MVYTISMKTQRKSSMTQITSIDQQTVSMYSVSYTHLTLPTTSRV